MGGGYATRRYRTPLFLCPIKFLFSCRGFQQLEVPLISLKFTQKAKTSLKEP